MSNKDEEIKVFKIKIDPEIYADLKEVKIFFQICIKTFIHMAISHGIDCLKNNYVPTKFKMKKENNDNLKKNYTVKLFLPAYVWNDIKLFSQKLELRPSNLINTFLDMELRKYRKIMEEYKFAIEECDNYISKKARTTLEFKADISSVLMIDIEARAEKANISSNQMIYYLLTNALIHEHHGYKEDAIYTDSDLLNEINKLNLGKMNALMLVRYVLKTRYGQLIQKKGK